MQQQYYPVYNQPKVIIEAKPTWSLAWGLYWRMLLLQLAIVIPIYIIFLIIGLAASI